MTLRPRLATGLPLSRGVFLVGAGCTEGARRGAFRVRALQMCRNREDSSRCAVREISIGAQLSNGQGVTSDNTPMILASRI